jgi:hypothetical protein
VANGSIVPLFNAGLLCPLDDLVKQHGAGLLPSQLVRIEGQVMAVAFMANAQHLLQRANIREQAGVEPPATLQDALAAAEAIRGRGILQHPFALVSGAGWNTLWMLHSFLLNIPKDLDESAMVDGCARFQALRHVIVPVMRPGVITTGIFSFLLAYDDFAVTAMLLSQQNQTMVPRTASFLGSTQVEGSAMFAVAAVVSATAPLFVLILFFQRQIVSGLTAGGVKG